jgi:hypothetical protein
MRAPPTRLLGAAARALLRAEGPGQASAAPLSTLVRRRGLVGHGTIRAPGLLGLRGSVGGGAPAHGPLTAHRALLGAQAAATTAAPGAAAAATAVRRAAAWRAPAPAPCWAAAGSQPVAQWRRAGGRGFASGGGAGGEAGAAAGGGDAEAAGARGGEAGGSGSDEDAPTVESLTAELQEREKAVEELQTKVRGRRGVGVGAGRR